MSEAHVPAQHRRTPEVHFARLQHDRLMKWQMIRSIIFAKVDTEQNGVAWNLHGHTHFIVLTLPENQYPAHTPIKLQITAIPIFTPGRQRSGP